MKLPKTVSTTWMRTAKIGESIVCSGHTSYSRTPLQKAGFKFTTQSVGLLYVRSGPFTSNNFDNHRNSKGATMDKQYVENEFNAFIAFPTADKNVVSSASAKLFAEHIAYPLECEIDTLREDVRVLHANNRVLIDQRFDLMEVTAKQSAALKLAREAIGEVQDLIGESHGVYGLHLNGDESPWGELEQGGRFERLTSLNEALAAIDALKGE